MPTLRWLTRPVDEMEAVGAAAIALLREALGAEFEIELGDSTVGDRQRRAADGGAADEGDRDRPSPATGRTRSRRASARRARRSSDASTTDRFLLDLRGDLRPRDVGAAPLMPFIVGTAGHIDHGKTALVKALTGQDTDRLKEEKERGISIDLGFA